MAKVVTKTNTPEPVKTASPAETAADRRNYLKRKAGWPAKAKG